MPLHPSIERTKQPGVADAVLLPGTKGSINEVSEDSFLENLETRFKNDVIYTYIGNVVVSVNPYKPLAGLYGPEAIKQYRGRYYYEVPPHIFALTDDAYRDMNSKNRDQCIIISGESGAGKTECSKYIMQFIASVSSSSVEVDRVKEVLIKSNPILEAFGNAKTNRNNNSSRFGKYMDIQFNYTGDPIGGHINNYLLEKSRVTNQAQGERSFHIMYYLIESGLTNLKLKSAKDFAYLSNSDCFRIPGVDDKREFELMNSAMKAVGFSADDIKNIYEVIAGILHLGNITFEAGEKDGSIIKNSASLEDAAKLLGTTVDRLQDALLNRTVVTQRESVKTPKNVSQAVYARDAIAKASYFRLFDYVVSKINDKIKFESEQSKVIGVLDIYGFEVFQTGNGFEQLCINYGNEKLQQLFIALTLKEEQEEYAREGIQWTQIDYFNNAIILDLIENTKIGVISTLDEECLRPGNVTDKTFLEKLDQRHAPNYSKKDSSSSYYESKTLLKTDKTLTLEQFRLKHYAGNVTYDIKGFIEKNMDNVCRDLKSTMSGSKNSVLNGLFKDALAKQESTTKITITTATVFKTSLNELVQILRCKNPHYVRCIKSNGKQASGVFDSDLCRHQVRYLGLLENVRVRRAGFVFRQSFELFLERYHLLCPKTWPKFRGSAKDGVLTLLKHLNVSDEEYRLGVTKIFIRKPNTLFSLEENREKSLPKCATLIQKVWKGYVARKSFVRLAASYKIMQFFRKTKSKRFINNLEKTFKGVNTRPDFGKIIPWPRNNVKSLQKASDLLKQVFIRWRAEQIIFKIPADKRDFVRLKLKLHNIFNGRKPYELNRTYVGDYLNTDGSLYKEKYAKFKQQILKGESVIFSAAVQKSTRNGKGLVRLLVLTPKYIHLVHEDFSSKKPPRSLADIDKMVITGHKDYLVVLKMRDGADFILDFTPVCSSGGEKISELAFLLLSLNMKNEGKFDIQIVPGDIDATTLAGKYQVHVEKGQTQPNGNAIFKTSRTNIVVSYKDL